MHIHKKVRLLFKNTLSGVLATHSLSAPGYPFGSSVPFAFLPDGSVLILISDLAEHTKNIRMNPCVSLTVTDTSKYVDTQLQKRMTLLADATELPYEPALVHQYLSLYPNAKENVESLDFCFFKLQPKRLRYIAGLGDMGWLDGDVFLQDNPFDAEQVKNIVRVINDACTSRASSDCPMGANEGVEMITVDREGFWLRNGEYNRYVVFQDEVSSTDDVAEQMEKLAGTIAL